MSDPGGIYKARVRASRRAAGLCVGCGVVPCPPGQRCMECRGVHATKSRVRAEANRRARIALGLCFRCGKFTAPFGRGCAKCRGADAARCRARRARA